MKRIAVACAVVMAAASSLGATAAAPEGGILEKNKAVARQFLEEAFGPHWRVELVDRLHTADFVLHTAGGDLGLEDDRAALLHWKTTTPDLVIAVDQIVAEGDMVAVRWTATGSDRGGFLPTATPPTGKKVQAQGMTFWRLRDGRIAEEWGVVDMFSVLKQLGGWPAEGSASER